MAQEITSKPERNVLCEPSRRPQVAVLKRVFEHWSLDRAFHDAYLENPEAALASTGLDADPVAVYGLLMRRLPDGIDECPESLDWYSEFIQRRVDRNRRSHAQMAPKDPRFRDWCARQRSRCSRDLIPLANLMSHHPVTYELSFGCSVGCSFCAVSAQRLTGVFRHTPENAALWRDVLARMHDIVGDAAGMGTCYYATEPLDNPDYELFLKDYFEEYGRVPQTTTAAATRDIERTRDLIRWGQEAWPHFDRISVLNERDRDLLLASFTPEELIFTDLLPQFEGAPVSNLKKVGRNRDEDGYQKDTICCASGFVVNMVEKSVRLLTPVPASEEHPTGELVYEKAGFSDGAELEAVVLGMIDRYMHETISLKSLFGGTHQ